MNYPLGLFVYSIIVCTCTHNWSFTLKKKLSPVFPVLMNTVLFMPKHRLFGDHKRRIPPMFGRRLPSLLVAHIHSSSP